MLSDFSPLELIIMVVMRLDRNVAITHLHYLLFGERDTDVVPHRKMQQRVGATIARANVKLERQGRRIVPGKPRGTYVLRRL